MTEHLVLTRELRAAPAVAFDAWITPSVMRRWMFTGDSGEIVGVTADPRPGGTYSIRENRPDGEVDQVGTYTVVDRPRRLEFSLHVPAHCTTVSVTIEPVGGGCRMTFTQSGIEPDATRTFWEARLDDLARVLAVPVRMRDRWADRREMPAGVAAVYWHVLVGTTPAVQAAAADVRRALRDAGSFHLTPPEWLHMTLFLAGITDDVTGERLADAVAHVADALRGHPPVEASVDRVRYHPEAITLAVEPRPALRELRERLRTAGRDAFPGPSVPPSGKWVPHVTVAYSTADQPTAPIVDRLGVFAPRRFTIDTVSLVVQTGPERSWIWRTAGCVRL